MGRDAVSRSLGGQRKFSASELARLAEILGVSRNWLITGATGPAREASGIDELRRTDQDRITETVAFPASVYREIGLETPVLTGFSQDTSPEDAAAAASALLSERLGKPFIHDLPASIEGTYGVGVFVVAEGSTFDARSMHTGSVSYIVVRGTGAWFQANLVLARELGHLLSSGPMETGRCRPGLDTWPSHFPSALLMPAKDLREIDWNRQTPNELALYLWESGVSAKALETRLATLGIRPGPSR